MKRQMHVRRALLPAMVMAAFALAGCGNQPGTTTASGSKTIQLDNPGPPAETINGEEVPMRLVDAIIHQRSWDPSRQDLRERALKEVTNIVLTAQAAAKETTGSIPTPTPAPKTVAANKPEPSRMPTIEGWRIRDVANGGALLEGREGLYEVYAGDPLPGVGRVDAIRRQDGRWVVVTSRGLIVAR